MLALDRILVTRGIDDDTGQDTSFHEPRSRAASSVTFATRSHRSW